MNFAKQTPRRATIAATASTTNAEAGPPHKDPTDDFAMKRRYVRPLHAHHGQEHHRTPLGAKFYIAEPSYDWSPTYNAAPSWQDRGRCFSMAIALPLLRPEDPSHQLDALGIIRTDDGQHLRADTSTLAR